MSTDSRTNLVRVGDREIGPGRACFIIAEVGVNHNGDPDLAAKLVEVAAGAGVDAVKFQTFRADRLVTRAAPKAAYQRRAPIDHEGQFEMLRRLELSRDTHRMLAARCAERGVLFLSSVFDEESADFLETLGVPAFKMGSGELTNLPLLRHVARKGRPLIISTGMATLAEVDVAVDSVRREGCHELALLHCVSAYPADPADANLRAMATLREAFGVPVGYSDHTQGIEVPLAAVALGACIVEKHFTLDRTLPGPDHRASSDPTELTALVAAIRKVEAALGDGVKRPAASEAETSNVARRSLVTLGFVAAGTILDCSLVGARRPGGGMAPSRIDEILGRRARRDIPEGTLLDTGMIQ